MAIINKTKVINREYSRNIQALSELFRFRNFLLNIKKISNKSLINKKAYLMERTPFLRNSVGVILVSFLKAVLKAVFELKPTSSEIARIVSSCPCG
jgi:hypothetical protein